MMTQDKLEKVSFRLATPEDAHLPAYDNTKLQAINTCPTWGIVRYVHHKTFKSNARAMPLEAGSACHEVFAAVRLVQLYKEVAERDEALARQFFLHHGERLFGEVRFKEYMLPKWDTDEDVRTRTLDFCLEALYTSGFYDDPSDRRRTMANLEEACTLYIERWDWKRMPIWVREPNDFRSDVGIEYAFDIVLEFTYESGVERRYRFVGKFDGVHWRDGNLSIGENKTGARLDDAWAMSFQLSSQVTGYCIAASVWCEQSCDRATVFGLQLPLPKSYDDGLVLEHVRRESHHFKRWLMWFLHTVTLAEQYQDDPTNAPRYTHSCNRYFRPCSFIPFCYGDDEEAANALEEMVVEEWSPLHEKSGD
jgi:hypothetical protein